MTLIEIDSYFVNPESVIYLVSVSDPGSREGTEIHFHGREHIFVRAGMPAVAEAMSKKE
jgi:hypothetical protein